MLVKTVQVNTFKSAIESIKDILGEVTMNFDPVHGLTMPAVDAGNKAFVLLTMRACNFEIYDVSVYVSATFDIGHLYKIVKNVSSHSFNTMSFSVSDNTLNIILENTEIGAVVSYGMRLVMDPRCGLDVPEIDYGVIFLIDARVFSRYLRDIQAVANMVRIRVKNNKLVLVALGVLGKCKVKVPETPKPEPNGSKRVSMKGVCFLENNLSGDDAVSGTFVVRYLTAFCKAVCLGSLMKVKLKQDMPICCEFEAGGLGTLRYYLCPH